MLNLVLSLSMLVPSALAEDYVLKDNLPRRAIQLDKYELNPGTVNISGVVEVPLMTSYRSGSIEPKIAVRAPELDYAMIMPLDLGRAGIRMSEEWITAAGGTIKQKADGKVGNIPELRIGELVLTDVDVLVGANSFGVLAFENLAVAILPSQGVVRFAASADAEGLISAVGAPLSYTTEPTERIKYMRQKSWVSADPLVIDGSVNGAPAPIYIGYGAQVAGELVEGDPLYVQGLHKRYVTTIEVAGVQLTGPLAIFNNPSYYTDLRGAGLPASRIANWDIAVDPSTRRVAIKELSQVTYVSTWEMELGKATADLEKAKEGEDPKLSGPHTALAKMHLAHNEPAKAVEYANLVVSEDPDSCSSYALLGHAQAAAGEHAAAIATFTKAGELYDTWAEMDIEARDELAEASIENPELKKQIQSHGCYDVWGSAALTALELGDFDQVAALYADHHDLDASLAQAAALAYLAQERYADANAALIQMRLLSSEETADVALTRAVVQHAQGNPKALENYRSAAILGGLVEARAYAVAAVDLKGAEGPELLKAFAEVDPNMALAYAEALDAAELPSEEAWAAARDLYAAEEVFLSKRADFYAGYGQALRHTADLEGATAALKTGLELDPKGAELLLLAGDMAADSDDYERAKQLYAKAAKASPTTATYAGLLSL